MMMWFASGGQWTRSHCRNGTLFALDQQQRFAGEHEEVLLVRLPVVHAHRLAGREDVEPEAHLLELRRPLERRRNAAARPVAPAGVAGVEDEPALARGDEPGVGLLERGFRDHVAIVVRRLPAGAGRGTPPVRLRRPPGPPAGGNATGSGTTTPSPHGSHSSSSRYVSSKRGWRSALAPPSTTRAGCATRLASASPSSEDRPPGRSTSKHVAASATACSNAPGSVAVEVLGVVRPTQAEELVDGVARADRAVTGDGVAQPLPIQVGALADEESRLEQGDGADELRRVEREAERDDAAERVPDDVRAIDAEMREHPAAVGGLLRERQRPVGRVARSP